MDQMGRKVNDRSTNIYQPKGEIFIDNNIEKYKEHIDSMYKNKWYVVKRFWKIRLTTMAHRPSAENK